MNPGNQVEAKREGEKAMKYRALWITRSGLFNRIRGLGWYL